MMICDVCGVSNDGVRTIYNPARYVFTKHELCELHAARLGKIHTAEIENMKKQYSLTPKVSFWGQMKAAFGI